MNKKELKAYGIKQKNVLTRHLFCKHRQKREIKRVVSVNGIPYMQFQTYCKSCGREF